MPNVVPSKWLTSKPIAHRGLHNITLGRPENSLESIALAVEHGFPIEIDVRLLSDGNVVVFHDDNLKRMTGVDRLVEACRYDDLKPLRLLGTSSRIPRLLDVLSLVQGKAPLLIEIKNTAHKSFDLEQKLTELIADYKGDLAIQSFNPFSLLWYKRHAPRILRGQISGSFKGEDIPKYKKLFLRNLAFNAWTKPNFVTYEFSIMPNLATNLCKAANIPILGWTVKSLPDMKAAYAICDNIIFEGFAPSTIPCP